MNGASVELVGGSENDLMKIRIKMVRIQAHLQQWRAEDR